MSILELYEPLSKEQSGTYADLKKSRQEIISEISKVSRFDVVIAGGGIQGASFARLAAFNNLKVLLLEINDYAGATSGRTSKMAHGGLRYLEYFDFKQVMEGVKAREEFYQTAPHLVSPQEFLIPIYKGQFIKRIKLALGLKFYDLFLNRKSQKHKWINIQEGSPEIFSNSGNLSGFFKFYDGLMHDVRLVIENIYAARQEGAICLNHARVDSIYQKAHETEVAWTDCLSGQKHVVQAGIVVNTGGAWAPTIGRIASDKTMGEVRFSQGTHLMFDKKWDKPAILVPLPGKGRNYFVWPHPSGTMVGTTEKVLEAPLFEPLPTKEEVQELLERIERDLSGSGLTRDNLYYAFAGIRTLPSKGSSAKQGSKQTFKLSRRHIWKYSQGVLTLLGGKYTSAAWTALEGLKLLYKYAGIKRQAITLNGRLLPGAYNLTSEIESFKQKCSDRKVPEEIVTSCVRRLGSRVKILTEIDKELNVVGGRILEAELKFALDFEQAETIDDIFSRRLDLEFTRDGGLSLLTLITEYLKSVRPQTDWSSQSEKYRERILQLKNLLA